MCKCSYIYNTHWLRLVSILEHKALYMYMYLWCLPILQKTRNNMGHVCAKKKKEEEIYISGYVQFCIQQWEKGQFRSGITKLKFTENYWSTVSTDSDVNCLLVDSRSYLNAQKIKHPKLTASLLLLAHIFMHCSLTCDSYGHSHQRW